MSYYATETYSKQSGGLATYSHLTHQKQQTITHNGVVAVFQPTTKQQQQQQQQQSQATTATTQQQQQQPATVTIEVQQQQQQQQQQLQQQTELVEQPIATPPQQQFCPVAALLSSSLLSTLNAGVGGYDVLDNKTNESIPIYIQKHQRYIMNDIFHREDERLKTFDTWPLDWMDKQKLAQTGMFYTGEDDKVKCYFCEVEIGRWEHTDHPVSEHLRWFPNCPLLRRRTTNNVPIDAEALDRVLPPVSYDICGANDAIETNVRATQTQQQLQLSDASPQFLSLQTNLNSTSPTATTTQSTTLPAMMTSTGTNTNTNNVQHQQQQQQQTYFPEYPEYAIETARLRSFAEWPRHMKQKPEQLAEAGFFYIGKGDRVKCFSCGGGLKDWADDDEPWEQHTLWMSKCRFLKLMKGQNYIDTILAKQQQQKQKHELESQDKQTSEQQQQTTILLNSSNNNNNNNNSNTAAVAVKIQTNNTTTTPALVATNALTNSIEIAASGIVDVSTAASNEACKPPQDSRLIAGLMPPSVGVLGGVDECAAAATANAADKRALTGCIPEEKLCKICYADEYNTAFLPCGHVVACAKCASSVTKCPLCRKPFTDVMRVYFS